MAFDAPHRHRARRGGRSLAIACLLACPLARADIAIDVQGVEDELRDNVLAFLSLTRYLESEPSRDTIERLHDRVERETRAALRPFGYYEPTVRSELVSLEEGDWRVSIRIEPGRPVLMESIDVEVTGAGADNPLFERITDALPLREGEPLSHAAYEQIKTDLQRTAATYGFLDARLLRSELRVDPARHSASAVLEFDTGPRYRFGTTAIEQDVIDEMLVRRFMRYQQDDPFDVTELLRTQFALDDSQYFSTVEVLPGEPDRSDHVVPISIRAAPSRRDRYSFGLGYGTDSGARGTASWDRRRVNPQGHRFYAELEAAEQNQSLEGRYIVPIGDPALEKLSFELMAEQRELADLDVEELSFEPSITRVAGRWQRVWFVTAAHTQTESALERRIDTLLIPGLSLASVPRGYLGETLFQRGLFAELRGSHALFGSDADFLQLRVQGERVLDIGASWHLLVRGEVGASLVGEFSELPGSVRFFAGGDRSVRGFGLNELSPVEPALDPQGRPLLDAEGEPVLIRVGGRHLLTGTLEIVRDLPRSFAIAAFVDFGNAFDDFGEAPDAADPDFLEYSAGLGVRWRLPVVTVGLDVAQPLSEPGAGPRLHINFSPRL